MKLYIAGFFFKHNIYTWNRPLNTRYQSRQNRDAIEEENKKQSSNDLFKVNKVTMKNKARAF